MAVSEAKNIGGKTIFSIHEFTRFEDKDKYRRVVVPHNSFYRSLLPKIKKDRLERTADDGVNVEATQEFDVPAIGRLVFFNRYNLETAANSYRSGVHETQGPFVVE